MYFVLRWTVFLLVVSIYLVIVNSLRTSAGPGEHLLGILTFAVASAGLVYAGIVYAQIFMRGGRVRRTGLEIITLYLGVIIGLGSLVYALTLLYPPSFGNLYAIVRRADDGTTTDHAYLYWTSLVILNAFSFGTGSIGYLPQTVPAQLVILAGIWSNLFFITLLFAILGSPPESSRSVVLESTQ